MSKEISCALVKLNSTDDAAALVDHALQQCLVQSRPVYIALPTDMVQKKVEGARLAVPLSLNHRQNDPAKEQYVLQLILKALYDAKSPVILVDSCAIRNNVIPETEELIDKANLPVFVTPMGKGAINESNPNYGGVYAGNGSQPQVKERVEAADLILNIGSLKSDFNTTGFSYKTSQLNTIDFHSTHTTIAYSEFPGVTMKGLLKALNKAIDSKKLTFKPGPSVKNEVKVNDDKSETITQAWIWPKIGESFLQENDIVVTETGTANFGIWETKFPKGVSALSQVLWGSIGWSVGACQGAALASRDTKKEKGDRRTILFVGDGSFQLTAQEVSTMIRNDLKPIIFVICNDGYTIERYIHGSDAEYNDVNNWKYKDLVNVFGGEAKKAKTWQVKTKKDVSELFAREELKNPEGLQFVEMYMERDDAPRALKLTAEASAKTNSKSP